MFKLKNLFESCMKSFNESNIPDYPVPSIINDELLDKLRKQDEASKGTDEYSNDLGRKVLVCEYLKEYAESHGMPFDYIIIPTTIFNSNFSKKHLRNVLVKFKGRRPETLGSVCRILSSEQVVERDEFYYLFYRRGEQKNGLSGRIDNVSEFCKGLVNAGLSGDR